MNIFKSLFSRTTPAPPLSMELISHESFGPVNFTDSYKTVLKKLKPYAPLKTTKMGYCFDKPNKLSHCDLKALYIESAKLFIVFNQNSDKVLYFEVERGNFIHNGVDLFKMKYEKAKVYAESLDSNITIDDGEDGFESKELGLSISRSVRNGKPTGTIEYALAFSYEYDDIPRPSADELIQLYMKD